MTAPILEIHSVDKRFAIRPPAFRPPWRRGAPGDTPTVQALNNVSLTVNPGQVVGIVGESGCGKSTLARIVAGLARPSAGSIHFEGQAVTDFDRAQRLHYTLAVQMVFQNPFAALNPRHRISRVIGEAPAVHGLVPAAQRREWVAAQLARVGLAAEHGDRFPHQFSGGQRQRIGIARALAVSPKILVCDEVVSALDVSIQAQILNLLLDLRAESGLTCLFISHDLSVIRYLCDQVAVMYLGRIVEEAPAREFFAGPLHPYSQGLLAELPVAGAGKRRYAPIRGEIPSPIDPPSGCHFHPRCPFATDRCRRETPRLQDVAPGQRVACHLLDRH
jgi:peptide/nickel transport system ATP-binding protein